MQQILDSLGVDYSVKFLKALLRISSLLVIGLVTIKLVDSALRRLVRIVPDGSLAIQRRVERRAETIRHVIRSVGRAILGSFFVLYLASEVGLDLGPLLTFTAIAGVAIGFGAQSLVKDVIAGFFVVLEDQYGVGDTVKIAGLEGIVEEMTLRATTLRSGEGEVHVIPNGNIVTVSLLSRDWRRATVDISVARKEDLGRTFAALSSVGESLAQERSDVILDKPAIVGVEKLTGVGTKVRVTAKTLPLKQGEVEHEWRRRIKEAFDKEGIQLVAE
jgi:small-conductance mechanosensitive channel